MGTELDFYNEYHNSDWLGHDIPEDITKRYEMKACLKMSEDKQVYLVTSKTNWKKYILKALSSHSQESLEEEYKLSMELSHPGIIATSEYIKGTDYNYLIREYVEGNTVTELVEMTGEDHLQSEDLIRITTQLCDILQYLHSQKPPIIHRDIKPDNIIITKQKDCMLIDFGISRRYQGEVDTDTFVMGTQFSAPPEQYGFAQTNARSDIYSIGVLMFYMATGSLNIKERKKYQIPGDIRSIIRKCTRFSPEDRYTSVKQLKNKLISYPYLYKKRRMLSTGILSIALLALIITLSALLDRSSSNKNIQVSMSDIDSPRSSTVLTGSPRIPATEPPSLVFDETASTQEIGESNLGLLDVESTPVVISDFPVSVSDQNIDMEQEMPDTEPFLEEASDRVEMVAQATDIVATVQDLINTTASQPENQKSSSQDEKVMQIQAPLTEDKRVYEFKSSLIESAVREILGISVAVPITYNDLEQITSLFLCGQQRYERWDEHFVYGASQYMIGSQYNEKQLFAINGQITSLEDITHMPNIEKLALYNQNISDLTPLKDLHYLSYLGVGCNNISELEPVLTIKSLNYLDISGNPIMNDDIEPLSALPYLWGLDLGGTKVTSIYGIKDLKLAFLSLLECKMGDCIGLDEMITLDSLTITGVNNAISERALDKIALLTNLRTLKIFGSQGFDLSKLSSLKSLYLLDLCGMWDCSSLKNMNNPSLEQLYIDIWRNLDLSGVENLTNVTQISLRDSECSDYTPLLKMKSLEKVYCGQEQLTLIRDQLGEVNFVLIAQ
jgi:serine/threonine protein kinase/Leucine-rich repeat (LRR) protein